jgi:hypothetical protein
MNQMTIHFVDPTIPGISGRDLQLGSGRPARVAAPSKRDLRGCGQCQQRDEEAERGAS